MPILATENKRFSNLVKQELWASVGYCRDVVTVNEATAKTYIIGTVLGTVTASGKYKISTQAAADGTQTPSAVVLADMAIAATTDTKVLVMTKGPAVLSKTALDLDASFGTAPQKAFAYAALEAKNINIVDAV